MNNDKTFESSFDYFKSYFKHLDSTFTFDTALHFDGRNVNKESEIPSENRLPEYLCEKWILPAKYKTNGSVDFLSESSSFNFQGVGEAGWMSWCPYAGFWFEMNSKDRFIFYEYEMFSATNGGFWVVWMASFNEDHELMTVEDLAVNGAYDTGGYYENKNGMGTQTSTYSSSSTIRFESREIISSTQNISAHYHEFNDKVIQDVKNKERKRYFKVN